MGHGKGSVSYVENRRKDQKRLPREFFLSRDLNMTNRSIGALFFILSFAVACGGSDTTAPARVRFTSTLTAAKCVSDTVTGSAAMDTVTRYTLTANWQGTGTWKAVFTSITTLPGFIPDPTHSPLPGFATTESDFSLVDGNQSKTSACVFLARTQVYAILDPVTVPADADASPTITLP
jgi:hypothetical protein